MIGKFLHWIGLAPTRPPRPGNHRPTGHSQRRLAIEPIEDRLLLSAAAADTVSEGGTVVLDSFYSAVQVNSVTQFDRVSQVDQVIQVDGMLSNRVVTEGERKPAVVPSTDPVDVQNAFDQTGELSGRLNSLETIDRQAAPSPKEVAPEDLAPAPPDSGMVDVTHAAHDLVFAEIGSTSEKADSNDLPGLPPSLELATDSPLAANAAASVGQARQSLRLLTGSRGRLAAFDLALQQETDWRANLGPETPADSTSLPATEAGSPRLVPVTPAAFSSYEPDSRKPPLQPNGDGFRLTSSGEFSQIFPDNPIPLALPEEATPSHLALADPATDSPSEPDADDAVTVPAVYLDQRREKPVAHLVIAVGIGQALMGRRPQSAEEPGHEQLPPRKRS